MVRSVAAVLVLMLLPAVAAAQQPEERTHAVERGNTLWSLADAYYGDPYAWPRIFEANRDLLEDPDLLEPGVVLRIPDESAGPPTAAVNAVRAVAVRPGARPADSLAEPGPDPESVGRPSPALHPRTTFYEPPPGERASLEAPEPVPEFSRDDAHRAPWLLAPDQDPESTGVVDGLASDPDPGSGPILERMASTDARRPGRGRSLAARPFDEVRLRLHGPAPAVGARLQAFRVARTIRGLGRVVVPTATLVVTESSGEATLARVDAVFDRLAPGDGVRPLPEFPLTPGVASRPATLSLRTRVVGFAEDRPVYGPGHHLFLGDGSEEGVQVGDVFEVVGDEDTGGDATRRTGGAAQVVSVHDGYSTARIVSLENPVFATGVVLRLSRRMP